MAKKLIISKLCYNCMLCHCSSAFLFLLYYLKILETGLVQYVFANRWKHKHSCHRLQRCGQRSRLSHNMWLLKKKKKRSLVSFCPITFGHHVWISFIILFQINLQKWYMLQVLYDYNIGSTQPTEIVIGLFSTIKSSFEYLDTFLPPFLNLLMRERQLFSI